MKHELILHKIDGSRLNLYNRNAGTLSTVTSGEHRQTLNSDDIVMITVESAVKITFDIGDRLNVFGRWYKINRLPTVRKTGNRLFTYTIELEGVQYDLARATYDLTIDTTSNALQDVQSDTLTGNLERFATVLVSNANRVFPGKWELGELPEDTEDKTLMFGETDNCLSVLQRLCTEYNTEFDISQSGGVNTINFQKAGQIFPFTFEYGKGKGLYSLERLNVSAANIVTRLKVFGGTRNITSKYRANRLCLPGKTKGQSFIEKSSAINKYGVWEATKYFDDIYPKRASKVTGIDSGNVLKFVDNTMNFDLNEKESDGVTTKYLLPGVPAKIHFNSGNLSGYEFEILSYDHGVKTFTLKPFEDERGDLFPSEKSAAFQFGVNDEYVILDISLPQSYIDAAEAQLQSEGDTYYDQNSQPKVQYSLEVAEEFIKGLSGTGSTTNIFSVGDYIPIKDVDIDVDKSVRVQSFTRDLLNVNSYKLTISDTVTTSITNRVISDLIDLDKVVKINNLKDPARARRDWRSAQELLDMVFDVEGDYYTDKIKPNSIETQMLSVGAKSTQFGLVGTVIQANYNGNKNSVNVKGGVLTHYAIEEGGRIWNLADNTTTLTGDGTPYYIYARCQKSGTGGSIIFSTSRVTVNQDPSYYHFWVGVVNSADAELGVRSVALTYGFTTVNGRFIRTGRIQSSDGLTYFDLDTGEIGGKITFRSTAGDQDLGDWADDITGDIQDSQSAANAADAKAQQAIDAAAANVTEYNTKFAEMQNQVDGQVNNWFYPYVPTLANYPASDWTTNEIRDRHIGDTFTNTQAFVDNATTPNAGKSWRYVKNESTYSWTLIADSDAVKALLQASQAQATADGKSTTFLVQPSNYHLGDTWVLNSDRTVNGTAYKQGEILTATQDSTTFNEAHWLKRVRYAGQAEINEAVVKATYWSIKASSPVIYKDAINASTSGTHTPVTISGELRSGTTTTSGGFITVTPNGGTEAGTASASPVTIAPANGDGKTSYTVKLYDTASKTTLLDTQTIPVVFKGASGVNAISAVLSNEADVLPASSEGVVSDYTGSGTIIRVFEGATELTYGTGNGQYQVSASGSGITVGTPSTSGNRRVYGVASNMTSDNATITFTITGKTASGASFSLTKVQAFAKSRTGQKGADGVSISLVDVEFAKNTSPTTAPTTGWTTTAPTLLDGEQLWTRTKTAYSSGNPTYSTPANITPKKGDTGAVGQGVDSVTEEYAISTSKTTQPTTGWDTTQPTWVQGQYIWSRVKVVYKNPAYTVYTGYAVSSEWEAVNNFGHSLRNLLDRTGEQKDRMIGPDGAFDAYIGSTLSAVPIGVTPGERLIFTKTNSTLADNAWRYAFYDSSGVFIQRFSPGSVMHTRVVPALAATLRASYPDDSIVKIERDVDHNAISAKQEAEQAQLAAEGYMRARYIRDYINFNSGASSCEWVEIKAIRKGGTNIAQGKPVSGNGQYLTNIGRVVDGSIDSSEFYWAGSGADFYVEIDLGSVYYDIDYIHVWHYYANGRIFRGTKTEISEDGVKWTTIFDSEIEGTYAETEEGKIHTNRWNQVMAKLNQSKAITDKFRTTIHGGLISTVLMMLREYNSEQNTAGISGLQGALRDQPSYWSGGTHEQAQAFVPFIKKIEGEQATTEEQYTNLPSVVLLHNGAGKIGDLLISQSGNVYVIDPNTGAVRIEFGAKAIKSSEELIAGNSPSGTATLGGTTTSTNQVLSGSTNVTKAGSSAMFNSTAIQLSASGRRQSNGEPSSVWASIFLRVGGVRKQIVSSVSLTFDNTPDYNDKTASIQTGSIPLILHNTGLYTFELVVTKVGDIHYESATVNATTFTWKFNAEMNMFQFGTNGFLAWFTNHGIHFSRDKGFLVRGDIDAPGAGLGGGRSVSTGAVSSRWGRVTGGNRSGSTTTIYHNIGDSNYTITVSPQSSASWYFQNRGNGSIQVVCSANFDFVLVRTPN